MASGSVEDALELLRRDGLRVAAKSNEKLSSIGLVSIHASGGFGVATQIACETDFAARSTPVMALAMSLPRIIERDPTDATKLAFNQRIHPQIRSLRVSEVLDEISGIVGESVILKSVETMVADTVAGYVHGNYDCTELGSQGALVGLNGISGPDIESFARLLARQVVACRPKFVSLSSAPQLEFEAVRCQLRASLLASAASPGIAEREFTKRWAHYCEETFLENSIYLSENPRNISVKGALGEFLKNCGASETDVSISGFVAIGN